MKISAEKRVFVTALARIQGITEKTSVTPVTTFAHIKAEKGTVLIAATNLQIGIQATYQNITISQEGSIAVNAHMLFDIVREMPEGVIVLEEKENYTLEINSGKKVKFKIAGTSPEDFPQLFSKIDVSFVAGEEKKFLKMMNMAAFSMSRDETTQNIHGMFIENIENGKIRMVATDGFRLAVVDETFDSFFSRSEGIIVPYKAVIELQKILQEKKEEEKIFLYTDEKSMFIRVGEIEFYISLIEKKFPDYRVIIPGDGYQTVNILLKKDEIIPALKRMSIISIENNNPVLFSFKGSDLELKTEDSDRGMVREHITLSPPVAQDVIFCINCSYLLEILVAADDDVELQYNPAEDNKPIIIRPVTNKENVKYIVMPMLMD